jgi:hypothetical protein
MLEHNARHPNRSAVWALVIALTFVSVGDSFGLFFEFKQLTSLAVLATIQLEESVPPTSLFVQTEIVSLSLTSLGGRTFGLPAGPLPLSFFEFHDPIALHPNQFGPGSQFGTGDGLGALFLQQALFAISVGAIDLYFHFTSLSIGDIIESTEPAVAYGHWVSGTAPPPEPPTIPEPSTLLLFLARRRK